ncbi:hypothetical protein GCM10007160_04690 [Litchfieldella qijiaojingensis]|uniref:Serine kinase n=1 Tax=Litchfieldella qijiaojingensis TaxID=980347 RepID=A0ABQ2YCY3_9GAMM|nr:hypothetical protein [Halomonas qijiaojingensis]GGX80251.1 hypothetical protein GCM10007160_04690 [Halomonas qijiaojingensis]
MVSVKPHRYRVFGLCLETDYRFRTPMTAAPPEDDTQLLFTCLLVLHSRRLSAAECLYLSPSKNLYGESAVQIYATQSCFIMRFPRVADFVLNPGEITCELFDPECDYLVEVCLLGHVLAYYLELIGVAAMHAGAVAVGERAVLFVANRTGGKSTLVASMVAAGCPLLADDIAALEVQNDVVVCRHGFPQLKLTPEQAIRFAGHSDGFPLVHPAFSKLNVPAEKVGAVSTVSLPLTCVYLLQRSDRSAEIQITPVSAGEALIQLIRHAFLAEALGGHGSWSGFAGDEIGDNGVNGGGLSASRFYHLAEIAQGVSVKRLRYPSGYDQLPQVHAAIFADLDESGRVGYQHYA